MYKILLSKKSWAIFIFLAATLFISRVNSPQNAKTGAPNEGTCADAACHVGINFLDGDFQLEGLPDVVLTDSTYRLKVRIENPNGEGDKAGFQLTAIDANNDSIGIFANPSFSSTIQTRLNRNYWEHLPSKNFDANNLVEYEVDWTAPSEIGDGIVKIYATSVISDGNGSATADLAMSFSDTVMIDAGVGALMGDIVNVKHVNCYNEEDGMATIRVEGGRPPFTYAWSNGSMDSTAMNLRAGLYAVTVTDQDLNQIIETIRIQQPDSLDADVQVINVRCQGDTNGRATITVTGGTRPYSYLWPDGVNTNERDNLASAIYTVVVRDANDCVKNVEVAISEPVFFIDSSAFIVEEISCFGAEDGAIDLRPGISSGTFSYRWNNGLNGPNIASLGEGQYEVTIADINDCQVLYDFELIEPEELEGTLFAQNISVPGASDGTIRANISGGTRPYTYQWSNGGSGFEIENLGIGQYQLTVTDARGCELELEAEIDEPDCMIEVLQDVFFTSCFMECDGTICPQFVNGTPPYLYEWLNGSTDSCLTMLCAGAYPVTVTDSRDCEIVVNFGVNEPAPLQVNSRVENNICAGDSDGSIQYAIFGGTPPYRTNPENLNNLESGIFAVTVSDANDCEIVVVDTVGSPEAIDIVIESTTDPDPSESNGSIEIQTLGGTIPYFYFWVDQDGFSVGNSEDVTDLPDGCYILTVIDANGCSYISDEICIGEPSSTNDFDLNAISIYPNPIKDVLWISGVITHAKVEVKLFNSMGQLVLERPGEYASSDGVLQLNGLSEFAEGLYFLQIENGAASEVFKIIKTH